MNFEVFIGLGTNLGDKKENLAQAVQYISQEIGPVLIESSLFETEPWGDKNQDNFYNQVIKISTSLFPMELIGKLLALEIKMGRVRTQKWAARIIDIDILAISGVQIHTQGLSVPHPYIADRKFVLMPWSEIAPEYIIDGLNFTIFDLSAKNRDESWIRKV
jgi:2-amino-4-hydroxy-6-hydroxymethyldihydropteridine diphosphokinase